RESRSRLYVWYTDDFVILAEEREVLEEFLPKVRAFLKDSLALDLHPKKIIFRKFHQNVDFLDYVAFPYYRLVRRKTVRQMFKKLNMKIQAQGQSEISSLAFNQSI